MIINNISTSRIYTISNLIFVFILLITASSTWSNRGCCAEKGEPIKTTFSSSFGDYKFEINRHCLKVQPSERGPVLMSGEDSLFQEILSIPYSFTSNESAKFGSKWNYYQGILKFNNEEIKFRADLLLSAEVGNTVFDDAVIFNDELFLLSHSYVDPIHGIGGARHFELQRFEISFKNKKINPKPGAGLYRDDRMGIYPEGYMGSSAKILVADGKNVYVAIPECSPAGIILYKQSGHEFVQASASPTKRE